MVQVTGVMGSVGELDGPRVPWIFGFLKRISGKDEWSSGVC